MDQSPPMTVSEWYSGSPPNCEDFYKLEIKFLDEKMNCLLHWTTGEIRTTASWEQVTRNFIGYPSGVRFIFFQDSGKDVEHWGGHFGARIDSPSLLLCKSSSFASISKYIPPAISKLRLPFVTHFNTGIGKNFFREGKVALPKSWNNLALQEPQPTFLNKIIAGGLGRINLNYDVVYEGGTSLQIFPGKLVELPDLSSPFGHPSLSQVPVSPSEPPCVSPKFFSVFRLFEMKLEVSTEPEETSDGNVYVSITIAGTSDPNETPVAPNQGGREQEPRRASIGIKLVWDDLSWIILDTESATEHKNEPPPKSDQLEPHTLPPWKTFMWSLPPSLLPPSKTLNFIDLIVSSTPLRSLRFPLSSSESFSSTPSFTVSDYPYLLPPSLYLGRLSISASCDQKIVTAVEPTAAATSWSLDSTIAGENIQDVTVSWENTKCTHYLVFNEAKEMLGISLTNKYKIDRVLSANTAPQFSILPQNIQ